MNCLYFTNGENAHIEEASDSMKPKNPKTGLDIWKYCNAAGCSKALKNNK